MLKPTVTEIDSGRSLQYACSSGIPYCEVLKRWAGDASFRREFNRLLAEAPFEAYRWETPPICATNLERPFEFVLINAPGFAARATDTVSFAERFLDGHDESGITSFDNLGGDATLVVPTPQTDNHDDYNHLAAFLRRAPQSQVDALWRVTAESVLSVVPTRTVWLNTAGGGVAWLHVRIDSAPKYYAHRPYRVAPE